MGQSYLEPFVLDLVQGLIKSGFYQEAVGKNFNLASGKEIKIIDMVKKVNSVANNKAPLKFVNRRKWDTKPRLLASIKKANDLIKYKPIFSFEEGLKQNIEWFEDNWDMIKNLSDFPPGMSSAVRISELSKKDS